jgi:4-amino-4-deoxy-L-arabinose transferase-like glycosyltransferase
MDEPIAGTVPPGSPVSRLVASGHDSWSREARPGSRRARDLAAIGGVALALRAVWVLVYGRTTLALNDTVFYEVAAQNLARGEGFNALHGEPTAHWPPGFPFLISLVYRILGVHPELGLVLNVVLATATAVLLYLVAERMLGRIAGLVAGGAFALLPGPIFFTGLFLTETTFIFILVGFLALALFLPARRWAPVVLGIAVGLAALTRGEGLLMAVIPLAMWWGHHPRSEWLRRSALLLAATALTILPWTVRNAIAMDAFIPVSTNASTTLWSGHNDLANGGPTYPPRLLLAQVRNGNDRQRFEVGEARLLRREAINWAIRNPHKELGLIPRKLLSLNGATSNVFPTWFNAGQERQVDTSGVIVFSVVGDAGSYFLLFGTLVSLVLIGIRPLWRIHPGMQGVLAYLMLCLVAYGFVYYGQFRYRIPMEPLMILVATPLLITLWKWRRALKDDLAPTN